MIPSKQEFLKRIEENREAAVVALVKLCAEAMRSAIRKDIEVRVPKGMKVDRDIMTAARDRMRQSCTDMCIYDYICDSSKRPHFHIRC